MLAAGSSVYARNPKAVERYPAASVLGRLRSAGFSVTLAAHAYAALDSYLYGVAVQEQRSPFTAPDETTAVTGAILQRFPAGAYPHPTEMAVEHVLRPGYAYGDELAFGLELLLDGLERARGAA